MADVSPVRQPWSRCVAHQSSPSLEASSFSGLRLSRLLFSICPLVLVVVVVVSALGSVGK